jgi:chromosome segregation ATPase
MEADLRLLNESIDIQKIQNKESDALLQDLSNELNELSREKKHLFHQWNSSVLALGRRDQALVAVSKASEKVTIAVNDNETELTVLKKEARVLTQKKENIEFDKNKIQNELAFLDENINKFRWEQEALASQIEIISKIVTKTKEEQTHEERAAKRLKSNTEALSRKIEMVSNQRREVENE